MNNKSAEDIMRDIFIRNMNLLTELFNVEDMNKQFSDDSEYIVEKIGDAYFPTGKIEIGDPLCYLNSKWSSILDKEIKPGKYPVYISIMNNEIFGTRYLSSKLDITGEVPVRYEIAMPDGYEIEDYNKPGVIAGFGVDTGLACFVDRETSKLYDNFLYKWHSENPNKNHYDDYFSRSFRESAIKYPKYQREDGDYLDYNVENTENNIIMFCSGFGDGFYSAYWGFDSNDDIVCLIIRFIDPRAFDVEMPSNIKDKKKYYLEAEDIKPLIKSNEWALATDKIMVEGYKIGYMYKDEPSREGDSGWIFYEGTESDEYLSDANNMGIYSLNTIANYDPEIIPFLNSEVDTGFYRDIKGRFCEEN